MRWLILRRHRAGGDPAASELPIVGLLGEDIQARRINAGPGLRKHFQHAGHRLGTEYVKCIEANIVHFAVLRL